LEFEGIEEKTQGAFGGLEVGESEKFGFKSGLFKERYRKRELGRRRGIRGEMQGSYRLSFLLSFRFITFISLSLQTPSSVSALFHNSINSKKG
jgi:hypothetical protein